MSIQALAAFLFSWVLPSGDSSRPDTSSDMPRWEKHPAEQRFDRENAKTQAALWSRIPRSY